MTNDQEVQYGNSASAARAIHSALSDICSPSTGHRITECRFTWTPEKQMETLAAYEEGTLLFTLTFTWNADNTLQKVVRS